MDDDDWDLHAVVRGCSAAVTTTAAPSSSSSAAGAAANNPFPYFLSNIPSHADQNSLDFPALMDDGSDPFQGLHEIYQEFCADDPPPTAAAATSIMPFPPLPHDLQPHQHTIMQNKPPVRLNMQIQENLQFNISPTISSPPPNFPAAIPQPVRPRRRKNQQMKMVRQMTQEELSADSWAWRKYGQKPIKGSPYPRNYYRCSTSKGCAARKQVERSPNDPEIFVVSYSGEHTHPRPTHRSSLAGSTRSKFASPPPAARVGAGGSNAALPQKGSMAASSSSPVAGSSFSPATPTMEAEAAAQNDDVQMADEEEGGGGEDDDDENILMMPSDFMNDDDDMLRGFQDSDDHSSGGGGDFFSGGLLSSPPWTPTGPAAPFNGGGGG